MNRPATGSAVAAESGACMGHLPAEDAISLLAHDMRSALSVARGFADALLAGDIPMGEHDRRLALQAIAGNTARALAFTEELLAVARAEAGALDLQVAPTDVRALLRNEIARASEDFPGHRFGVRTDDTALVAEVDARRVGQVVANLLTNAAKGSPAGTRITAHASLADDLLIIAVSDRGPGIPDDIRGSLFQKFRSPSRTGGTGLGLYLCRLIVEAHGGHIGAWTAPGSTVIVFCIPQTSRQT